MYPLSALSIPPLPGAGACTPCIPPYICTPLPGTGACQATFNRTRRLTVLVSLYIYSNIHEVRVLLRHVKA